MQDKIGTSVIEHNDGLKKELDKRYAAYQNGSAKLITASESKRRVQKVLKLTAQKPLH